MTIAVGVGRVVGLLFLHSTYNNNTTHPRAAVIFKKVGGLEFNASCLYQNCPTAFYSLPQHSKFLLFFKPRPHIIPIPNLLLKVLLLQLICSLCQSVKLTCKLFSFFANNNIEKWSYVFSTENLVGIGR